MIRIAYVINYIVKNGPGSVVLNLINNIDRATYDISLITLFSGNDLEVVAQLKDKGISVYECTTLSRMKSLLGQSNLARNKCKVTYWIGTIHRFYGLLETVSSWES